eukprot:2814694-Rhodomonas_salina.2
MRTCVKCGRPESKAQGLRMARAVSKNLPALSALWLMPPHPILQPSSMGALSVMHRTCPVRGQPLPSTVPRLLAFQL